MPEQRVDLLLLNGANYPTLAIYPYAFVQVGALARKNGLRFRCCDVIRLSPSDARNTVRRLITLHRPKVVGFTLRHLDSMHYAETFPVDGQPYLPAQQTRDLIAFARSLTDVPFIVGGLGYTVHPRELFDYLGVDYGVAGEPDDVIAHFANLGARRDLEQIANLLWRDGDRVVQNARRSYGPNDEGEYTPEVIDDLERFYGPRLFSADGPATGVSVEVSRGCAYRCSFCIEPIVKGSEVRYRRLDAVEDDVRMLAQHGVRSIFMVASELNIGKSDLHLQLAEMMDRVNADFPTAPLSWQGTLLPAGVDRGVIRRLRRSGYRGDTNGFPAVDDACLARSMVPYRSADIIRFTEALVEQQTGGRPFAVQWFLGNPEIDEAALANTLNALDSAGLSQRISANSATICRVFEALPATVPSDRANVFCPVDPPAPFHPMLAFAPALWNAFGSAAAITDFFQYVGSTFLTHGHRNAKRWSWFLNKYSDATRLRRFLRELQPAILAGAEATPADDDNDNDNDNSGSIVASWNEWSEVTNSSESIIDIAESLAAGDVDAQTRIENIVTSLVRDPDGADLSFLFAPPLLTETSRIFNFSSLMSHSENRPHDVLVNQVISCMLMLMMDARASQLTGLLEDLGLPASLAVDSPASEYRICEKLYARYASNDALIADVKARYGYGEESVELLLVRAVLYFYNVRIVGKFAPWLFGRS